jgi:putative membrane protein insertion efficiency factor
MNHSVTTSALVHDSHDDCDVAGICSHTRAQRLLLAGISLYQKGREGRPSPCRFWPSCSHYAAEAIETHGAGAGSWLTVRRLLRCRPFGPSGVDPVPLVPSSAQEI